MRTTSKTSLILLFCLLVFILFWKSGSWGLMDSTEGRYAEIGYEMYSSGDLMHPHNMHIQHYHKPPLTYWLTVISYYIFGVSAFAARFFLQVAFLLQCLLIFRIGRLLWERRDLAFQAVLVYVSFLIVWISVRNLSTDAYLNTGILATVWALLAYARKAKPRYLYLAAVFAAVAFMTKITASLVYIGPAALAIWYQYRISWKWSWHMLAAGVVYLVLGLGWFLYLETEGIRIFSYVFYEQSFLRYISKIFSRSKPLWFYLVLGPALSFPFIFILISGLIKKASRQVFYADLPLLLASFVLPFIFFSLSSSKLILYILPAFPFLALYLPPIMEEIQSQTLKIWFWIQMTFYGLLIGGGVFYLFQNPQLIPGVASKLFLVSGFLFLIVIALFVKKGFTKKIIVAAAGFSLILALFFPYMIKANEYRIRTTKPAAEWIKQQGLQGRALYLYDKELYSFPVHMNRPVRMIADHIRRETQFEVSDDYKAFHYDLKIPADSIRLLEDLEAPSVMLCRYNTSPRIDSSFLNTFAHFREIGMWHIYY